MRDRFLTTNLFFAFPLFDVHILCVRDYVVWSNNWYKDTIQLPHSLTLIDFHLTAKRSYYESATDTQTYFFKNKLST